MKRGNSILGVYQPPALSLDQQLAAQKPNPNIATNLAVAQSRLQNLAQQRAAFKAANPGVEIPGDPDMEATKKKEGMSKKKILMIVGGAVGVIGIGGLAYWKFHKKGKR
jgi:hypothetical protein